MYCREILSAQVAPNRVPHKKASPLHNRDRTSSWLMTKVRRDQASGSIFRKVRDWYDSPKLSCLALPTDFCLSCRSKPQSKCTNQRMLTDWKLIMLVMPLAHYINRTSTAINRGIMSWPQLRIEHTQVYWYVNLPMKIQAHHWLPGSTWLIQKTRQNKWWTRPAWWFAMLAPPECE